MTIRVVLLAPLLLLASCATGSRMTSSKPIAATLAVLPPYAETPSEPGPAIVRELLERHLVERGYVPLSASAVDKVCGTFALENNSDLTEKERQSLQAHLGVDAFLLVQLLAYSGANSPEADHRVAISLRLIDAQTGELIWQNQGQEFVKGSQSKSPEPILEIVEKWALSQLKAASESPLKAESNRLVQRLLSTLPLYHP